MKSIQWEWDEEKNRKNLREHKISFKTAAFVFKDPLFISRPDTGPHDEERWQTIGQVEGSTVFVVHTLKGDHVGGRIVSARKATKKERRAYEEGTFDEV